MGQLDQKVPPGACVIPELLEVIQTGLSQETPSTTRPLAGGGQVVNSIFKSTISSTGGPQHVPLPHGPSPVAPKASVCHQAGGAHELYLMLGRVRGQRAPGDLQHAESVIKGELALELEQQPAVTEEEVISTGFLQVLVEVRVGVSQQQLEVSELGGHGTAIRVEVRSQALHDATKADKGMALVVHDGKDGRGQVAHALAVGHLWVGNGVSGEQVVQSPQVWAVLGPCEVGVGPVGTQHILEDRAADELQVLGARSLGPLALELFILAALAFHVVHPLTACQPVWVHVQKVPPHHLARDERDEAEGLQMSCHTLVWIHHHPATLGLCPPSEKPAPPEGKPAVLEYFHAIRQECGPPHVSLELFMTAVMDPMSDQEGSPFAGRAQHHHGRSAGATPQGVRAGPRGSGMCETPHRLGEA